MQDFAQDPLLGSSAARSARAGSLRRGLGFGYAVAAYIGFFGAFGLFVLRTMGYAETWGLTYGPSFDVPGFAVLFDVGLVFVFAAQHSVMARQSAFFCAGVRPVHICTVTTGMRPSCS